MILTAGSDSAARWRGAWTALTTAALAIAAHAQGNGPLSGAGVTLILVIAGTVGAMSASAEVWRGIPGLAALLSAGQLVGHVVLAASGHSHAGGPTPAMVSAHAAAVLAGAVLIAAGDRLCRALSRTVRTLTAAPAVPAEPLVVEGSTSDQPLPSMLRLVMSLSRRGPPVGSHC